jgi:hypothetical protein
MFACIVSVGIRNHFAARVGHLDSPCHRKHIGGYWGCASSATFKVRQYPFAPSKDKVQSDCLGETVAYWPGTALFSPLGPLGIITVQALEHHQRVDIPKSRMTKRSRQTANDLKSKRLPKRDSPGVGTDNKIELHSSIPAFARVVQRVLTHCPSYTAPHGARAGHIATIADVGPATSLVRAHVVRSDNLTVFCSDEGLTVTPKPIGKCFCFRSVLIQRIGFASSDGRPNDAPN